MTKLGTMLWFVIGLQAQKELLDTELDLYKKMQAGEDTAQLRKKYTQLQLEVPPQKALSELNILLFL